MMKKRIVFFAIVLLFSIVGMLLSYMLTEEHYYYGVSPDEKEDLALFSQVTSNMCGEDKSFMDCGAVAKSKYSKIFNMPLAALGIIYFVILAFLAFTGMFVDEKLRQSVAVILFWFLAVVSLFNIVLLLLSIFVIKTLCPLCLATYVCSWVCIVVAILYLNSQRTYPFFVFQVFKSVFLPGTGRTSFVRACFALLVLIVSTGLGIGANRYLNTRFEAYNKMKDKEFLEKALLAFSKEEPIDMNPEPLFAVGDPDAPITIVEFSDLLCPYCSRAALLVDQLILDNPHKIRVIFMNYPLDTVCNAYVKQTVHPGACLFAAGAVCAAEQGKFEDYKRIVFSLRLENPKLNALKEIALKAGMDVSRLVKCVSDLGTQDKVLGQIEEAKRYGVIGTPILFINGKMYKGKAEKEWLQKFIDLELERLEKIK